MRILEYIFLFICFIEILLITFFRKRIIKYSVAAVIVLITGLVVNLSVIGIRWELIPCYIVSITIPILIYQIKSNKLTHKVLCILSIILIVISAILSSIFPLFNIKEPDGSYKVGRTSYYLVDKNRAEKFVNGKEIKRELMVEVWYPAENSQGKTKGKYIENSKESVNELCKNFGLPTFIFNNIKKVKGNSYIDAEISKAKEKYPVLVFSPGFATSRLFYTTLMEGLASNGYIIVSIDHSYINSLATVFPDGRVAKLIIDQTKLEDRDMLNNSINTLSVDQSFVIDELIKLNQKDSKDIITGKLDLKKIGVFGHSFGGAAAVTTGCSDNRVKGVLNYDGTLQGKVLEENITIPTKIVRTGDFKILDNLNKEYKDELLKNTYMKEEEANKYIDLIIKEGKFLRRLSNLSKGEILVLREFKHLDFSDIPMYSTLTRLLGISGIKNNNERIKIINKTALEFFQSIF